MRFGWDERKRLSNAEKHGLDFLDPALVFPGPQEVLVLAQQRLHFLTR
jgi:uncharacterized DUF497 family protein